MSTIQDMIPDNSCSNSNNNDTNNDNDTDIEKTKTSWNRSVYRMNNDSTLDDNNNNNNQKLEQYSTNNNRNYNKYTTERPHDRIDYRSEGGPLIEYLWTTPPSTTSTSTISTTPQSTLEQQQHHVDQLNTSTTTDEIGSSSDVVEDKEKQSMIIKEDNIDKHIDDQEETLDKEKNTTKNGKKKKQPKSNNKNNNNYNYNNNDILKGQTLYLGSEISNDGQYIYHIPGHAERILLVHIPTNTCTLIGPILKGKYKWLRGICINNYIYGLPCRSDTVLQINTITHEVSFLSIPYDEYYNSSYDITNNIAHQERTCEWKYHGGSICPIDNNIYCIPQSALHVLQINPRTNTCHFVGIPLHGKYKWYGGVIGKQDGAIYGIPHNSISVLRILPSINNNNNNGSDEPLVHVTLHGHITETTISPLIVQQQSNKDDEQKDSSSISTTTTIITTARDHKWHGAAAASDGTIVCVPANADTVLCIYPKSYNEEPELLLLGVTELLSNKQQQQQQQQQYIIQSPGRHRTDRKYKYLGATCNPNNGNVYCFPCAAERVLEINPIQRTAREIGPNLYDTNMERICQNKYQNGIYLPYPYNKIIGIPLAAETVLCIDFNNTTNTSNSTSNGTTNDTNHEIATTTTNASLLDEPIVTTWPLPQPYKLLGKCEGALVTPITNVVYCVPNCHKAVIRIEFSSSTSSSLEQQVYTKEVVAVQEEANSNQQQEQGTINEIIDSLDNKVSIDNNINNCNVDANDDADAVTTVPNDVIDDTQHEDMKTITNDTKSNSGKQKSMSTNTEMNYNYRPDYKDREHLIYKSGIPTLRSSSHRVKYNLKSRIHNPHPKDTFGNITNTLSLPPSVCTEDVFSYNEQLYQQLNNAIIQLLQTCNKDLVGSFRPFHNNQNDDDAVGSVRVAENVPSTSPVVQSVNGCSSKIVHGNNERLEDFIVPVPSTWRSVNGGSCENAQKYLSDAVATDTNFLSIFDQIVQTQAIPYMHRRIEDALSKENNNGDNGNKGEKVDATVKEIKRVYYYQRPPTIRLQPGPAWTQVKPHNDAEYGHQNGELNFWLPLTDRTLTGVDLYCETQYQANDYHPIIALPGQIIAFHGSSCRHYVNTNSTNYTRVSIDFRIGVQGYFDPLWQMKGTSDDHGRMEYEY